jgi:hypothetical protein
MTEVFFASSSKSKQKRREKNLGTTPPPLDRAARHQEKQEGKCISGRGGFPLQGINLLIGLVIHKTFTNNPKIGTVVMQRHHPLLHVPTDLRWREVC